MTKSAATLQVVAALAEDFRTSRDRLMKEAIEQVRIKMAEKEQALEEAVVRALEDDHAVTAVARAYTPPGSTPNRNAIYAIKKRHAEKFAGPKSSGYPFQWVARTVETRNGTRVVFDIHAVLNAFGPDDVTGEYTWTYDPNDETVEPVLSVDYDPYPTTKYYKQMLSQWLSMNPYPGEQARSDAGNG